MLKTRFKNDTVIEIGIDEAGRGSFWGPIMAGAVVIPDEVVWNDKQNILFKQLRDSKKISAKKREKLADEIKECVPNIAVGIVDADEINQHGIQWANTEAFKRAVENLKMNESNNCRLIIDGTLSIPKWIGEQELIIDGDAEYLAIAAASIIAKVEHDRWIKTYCENNPYCNERYDLLKSKGYGTLKHREGIKIYGGHELHRSLYIQNWLPNSITKTKVNKKSNKKITADKCLIKFNT